MAWHGSFCAVTSNTRRITKTALYENLNLSKPKRTRFSFHRRMEYPKNGGFDFAADPRLTCQQQPLFWLPELDTGTLLMTALPDWLQPRDGEPTSQSSISTPSFSISGEPVPAPEGQYFRIETSNVRMPAVYLGERHHDRGSTSDHVDYRTAFIIPHDEYVLDRTETLLRLCRLAKGLRSPDNRLTPGQKLRLRHMLQAADGDEQGASGREIAEVIYGRSRDKGRAWYESTYRFRVHRLIEDGRAMIDSGYRLLLRPKRRG